MKHYVLKNGRARWTCAASPSPERKHYIDVILAGADTEASAQIVIEFFDALNRLVENHSYIVNVRRLADEPAGGPLYWSSRTALFWGDINKNWLLGDSEKAWISQVVNLASRAILVGGAVLLLGQIGRAERAVAAVHPNFMAAAQEAGLIDDGSGIHMSFDSRLHSASTRLSALRLLSDFVSVDHGEHLADTLRSYIGLSEPKRTAKSHLAIHLIQRSEADPQVRKTVETMLENLEDPLRISDLAQTLGTSTRQLQRRFLNKTGTKLLATYRALRLERADILLRTTDLSQREISAATGFSSAVALGRAFRSHYRTTPDDIRNQRFAGQLSAVNTAV
ncbi:helix-turn-helix domain-containing protein [Ruegeria sp. Ofav3-42]|uniref:helix-turn-helix domain-containing protein n=1 Tax=Ruegeria sp. Ofav3-42 TaxID=2917759 RepID=UPI001EF44DF6|nr:helix-turn-helix domain-containing protein [Ruegeria sp. Ofav3-42]MCG7520959.1 helix-turn-helix domain-containing protein [Ruegeria sp. Ofav3-42]